MIDSYAEWDAAYVLGSLAPSDRREFENHLRDCSACSASVAELAAMPGLLRQLNVDDFEQPDAAANDLALPVSLLPRLAQAARTRKVRRRAIFGSSILLAGAAAATVIGLSIAPTAPAHVPVASSPSVELHALKPTNVIASVKLVDQKWGTKLDMECSYVQGAYSNGQSASYSLWVTSRNGDESQVATWVATDGGTVNPIATTDLEESNIASIDIRSGAGDVLLRAEL
jgi:Putative zinc-finger